MATKRTAIVPTIVAVVVTTAACTTFDDLVPDEDAIVRAAACGDACPGVSEAAPGRAETSSDGVKNGSETDVDCGGGAPTSAPKCAAGKACREAVDCVWGFCTANVCEGHVAGRKDGDQTDIDCGGTMSPACDWGKSCLVDDDCTSKACSTDKRCLTGPSCRAVHGGTTCGTGERGDADMKHEECCRSLLVKGFTDPEQLDKAVYLDKYEITAGRMRAFVEAVASANNGVPNIQAFMAAHRPALGWNEGWENVLPQANATGEARYTIVGKRTIDLLYPAQDKVDETFGGAIDWVINPGAYTVGTGVFFALGANHMFPEYSSPSGGDAAGHNLNCGNEQGSYGYSTYWFDAATIAHASGGVGKQFSKDEMDDKALNCAPFGLLAAFCAWDGGQLMTAEVFDFVAGGPWPPNPGGFPAPLPPTPPRLTGGNTACGIGGDTLITFPDGSQSCPNAYYYPDDKGNDFDGSSRIAPPGRIPADTVAIEAGDEPWMDLKGNLQEAVLQSNRTTFDYRGYGAGWSSVQAHKNQIATPRMKAGSFGSRCMRFK